MPHIHLTGNLKRFFPDLDKVEISAKTVAEVIKKLEKPFPGLSQWIIDEHGSLRQHVNIYVDKKQIQDREQLTDVVNKETEIFVVQALSGG